MSKTQQKMERDFHKNRHRVIAKKCKKVMYGNMVFHSGIELGKYLGFDDPRSVYKVIKRGHYNNVEVKYV